MLLVDDLPTWRESLRQLFEGRADILITEAIDSEDAIEKISANDFDLVLLDMKMPSGTEGLDVLQKAKRLRPQIAIIMMSAYGDIPTAVKAIQLGAFDFVPKEADFDDVIRFKVDEFIRRSHLIADRELLISAKYLDVGRAKSVQKKGKTLEDLLAALLASIDGFIEVGRNINTETEEIDLAFRNARRDPVWQRESEIILVECKNWAKQRVGKNEVVVFKEKIKNRHGRCKLGFLICTEKFAETLEKELLRTSQSEVVVVPIDGEGLKRLVKSNDRSQLLRTLIDEILMV
jgi:ActR/RegA family two-component response regulator/Holliday junction resolvase-like predicted endonuclease